MLVSASKDGLAVTPAQDRQFLRWMRYALGGHPLALQRLAAQGRIPNRLIVRQQEANQVHARLLGVACTRRLPQTGRLRDSELAEVVDDFLE